MLGSCLLSFHRSEPELRCKGYLTFWNIKQPLACVKGALHIGACFLFRLEGVMHFYRAYDRWSAGSGHCDDVGGEIGSVFGNEATTALQQRVLSRGQPVWYLRAC